MALPCLPPPQRSAGPFARTPYGSAERGSRFSRLPLPLALRMDVRTAEEASGKRAHELLRWVFPTPIEEIHAELLRSGRWDGELEKTRADGSQVVVASRWSLRRDEQGRPAAVLETNNDITERKRRFQVSGRPHQ